MYQYLHKHHIKISKPFRGFDVRGCMNYGQIIERAEKVSTLLSFELVSGFT
jgi:hypothetical protein